MTIYKDLKLKIQATEKELVKLKNLLKVKCPHNEIEKNSWCDDDWAIPKTYSHSFKCTFCGLYGSSDDKESKVYKKLEDKYHQQTIKRFKSK